MVPLPENLLCLHSLGGLLDPMNEEYMVSLIFRRQGLLGSFLGTAVPIILKCPQETSPATYLFLFLLFSRV